MSAIQHNILIFSPTQIVNMKACLLLTEIDIIAIKYIGIYMVLCVSVHP